MLSCIFGVVNLYLLISTISVNCRNDSCYAKRVKSFVHAWYRERVPLGYCVEFMIVDAKSQSRVFFGDKYYPCGPFCLCGFDAILGEHLIVFSLFELARFRICSE